jgi:hypothetical protein
MKILARSALMFLALACGMLDPMDSNVNTVNMGMAAEDSDADANESDCDLFSQDDPALFSTRRKAASLLTLAQLLDRPSVAPHVAGHHASSIASYKLFSVFRI